MDRDTTLRSAAPVRALVPPAGAAPSVQASEASATVSGDAFVRTPAQAPAQATKSMSLFATWKAIGHAIVSGQHTVLPAGLPAFPALDPTQLAQARQAGQGRTISQPLLSSDAAGQSVHDPVNFVIHGSRADLVRALEGQGWSMAGSSSPWNFIKMGLSVLFHWGRDTGAPVSTQYLNGHKEDMAFNKNSDYNRGRDHLRVYYAGKDPKTDQDTWDVAAVRDAGLTLTIPHPETHGKLWPWEWHWQKPSFNHESDPTVDGERDLVMKDLLASGLVRDWAAVQGVLPPGRSKQQVGDGRYMLINRYPTDGMVYDVALGSPAGQ